MEGKKINYSNFVFKNNPKQKNVLAPDRNLKSI
jgi:hypothetical protein